MALQLLDRVLQTGTANTTVSFSLTGAVTGYQDFSALTNGNTTYYAATDGTNWETGLGTYSSSGPTLTRTTVYQSSNSNTAVTFSGAVTIWIDYPSTKAFYLDASGNAIGLGTPASFVGTNITGTASGFTAGGATSASKVANALTVGAGLAFTAASTYDGSQAVTISASSSGATITSTSSAGPYYVVGASTSSGNLTTAYVSTSISYNASTNVVTAVQFSASSDERLKQDIKTIKNALQKIETLRGVSYQRNGKPEIGVIAQEVERVIPEVVYTDETEYGYKSVSYDNLVGLLIEAVKELSAEVKELKAKVSEN